VRGSYKEREKWTDVEEEGEKLTVKVCDYIINMQQVHAESTAM